MDEPANAPYGDTITEEVSPKPKRRKVDVDLSQTEGDDEICPSNAHSTLSAKLSSAEEDVHSLLNLPLEDAAEAGKFKLSVLARALRAAAAEGSLFDEVSHRKPSWCGCPERETPSICNRMPHLDKYNSFALTRASNYYK